MTDCRHEEVFSWDWNERKDYGPSGYGIRWCIRCGAVKPVGAFLGDWRAPTLTASVDVVGDLERRVTALEDALALMQERLAAEEVRYRRALGLLVDLSSPARRAVDFVDGAAERDRLVAHRARGACLLKDPCAAYAYCGRAANHDGGCEFTYERCAPP